MRFSLIISIIFILAISACQQPRAKKGQSVTSDCLDSNGNGICDDKDTDGDGVLDEEENRRGTDPNSPDSDGDGGSDLCEIQNNSDPLNNGAIAEACKPSPESQPPVTSTDDPALKATCAVYNNQKTQNEWLKNNELGDTHCEDITKTKKNQDGTSTEWTERVCDTDWSSNNSDTVFARNYGDPDAAERTELQIEVEWCVGYRDVLIIQNGVLSIRPWFKWYKYYYGSSWDDDIRYDFHLGDLPSTSNYCPDLKGMARVRIKDQEYSWFQPAFLPFKIPRYAEELYPFSTDAIKLLSNSDSDGIELLGSGFNNFSYPVHLISVENRNLEGTDSVGAWGSDDIPEKAADGNFKPMVRKVVFRFEYFKTIEGDEDSNSTVNNQELEDMCKEFMDDGEM